ncbi:NAD-dependent epimerase/dehydratase family protein [Pseudomonas berkeleyensis]|uniref:NAD-dependent epimerase/dehydratase family protein n=1 Tax=Pseudomonas berkeleyensis TaxID=2726956 RepID=A0A7G5DI00_9PSED|nr:NAD-dependent epimerase/dehydratase family protein [Pseudomonas berkeleyensis]QMV61375.1 NAD-dependent epimerase/dehydratase family protein [Pseudomonas berkeleyensis]WSO36804.1 NAD-dependent epimerase/dehydratase family protein [Pseudomonas berkeleyensis]
MTIREGFAGKGVLVTGGAGFIGSHLVDRLLAEGAAHVVVIDNLFVGSEDNLAEALASGKATFYRDDAELSTSLEYIFTNHAIDVVFNCATKALNYSFLNPANAFDTNVKVVLNLLELQRRGLFRTLCHFSTSEVYGSAVYEPMDEAHPRNPTTTYAAGKAAADLAVESYVRMFGVDAYIVRPFNNYGPRQNHKGMLAGVIPITAVRLLTGGTPEIHGEGTQSRDFIYVHDTVDAVVKLHDVLPSGETVNISTDNQISINELIPRICDHYGYTGEILRKPARHSDVLSHNASNERVKGVIQYRLTPFEQGLADTLDWYTHLIGKRA